MIWAKHLSGILCGPKARDPKLGATIKKIGILDQFVIK